MLASSLNILLNKHPVYFFQGICKVLFDLDSKDDLPEMISYDDVIRVLKKLFKTTLKSSWDILENLLLYTSIGKELDIEFLSLHPALTSSVSADLFVLLIAKKLNMDEVSQGQTMVQHALQLNLYKHCAVLIVNGAKVDTESAANTLPPVLACTKLVLKTGICI